MRIPTQKSHLQVLLLTVSTFIVACGVEVGNPGKPKTGETPSSQVSELQQKRLSLQFIVEGQYDEALLASLESYSLFDVGNSLSLLQGKGQGKGQAKGQSEVGKAASKKGRNCDDENGAKGELLLAREQSGKMQKELKNAEQGQLEVRDSYERSFSAKLSSADKTLKCKNDKMGPDLDWSQLNLIGIEATVDRIVKRSIKKPDAEVNLSETIEKAHSTHKSSIKKLSFDSAGLKLERTLGLDAELSTKNLSGEAEVKTGVQTLAGSPLVVEEVYNAASLLQSISISKGTLQSVQADGSIVQLEYKELAFDGSGTCQPLSGAINGLVLAPGTGNSAEGDRFEIVFEDGDASVKYEDGQKSPLSLERCNLDEVSAEEDSQVREADSQAKSNNGNGKSKEKEGTK